MHSTGVLCYGLEWSLELRAAADEAECEMSWAGSVAELGYELRSSRFSVILARYPVPDLDAAELLDAAHRASSPVAVLFLTEPGTPATEIARLVKMGAQNCLDITSSKEEIAEALAAARDDIQFRISPVETLGNWRNLLIGESPPMQDLTRIIHLVARRRSTVLIMGETGTGKEMAARAIHVASDRSHLPMVAINCSAIPENLLEAELFGHTKGAFTGAVGPRIGRFEEANNGTLFLDEIGDMPIGLQAKLLRVLQEREIQRLGSSENIRVNVRVIAASNLNLLERVKHGSFREDLYYRLNVVPVNMPPLRERVSDIPLLARHFVQKVCRLEKIPHKEILAEALRHLMRYSWPGNVRQLENLVEKAVVMSGDRDVLQTCDFALPHETEHRAALAPLPMPFAVPDHGIDFALMVTKFEKSLLDEALRKANGNKTVAADLLRLKRTTLVSKLRVMEPRNSVF